MKLDQLTAFDAIVETGTFRGAAERLNKSQSAVSHAIRQLEEELELELFSRDAYRPALTAEGEVLYAKASRVLSQMRDLKATSTRLRAREEAALRLAVTATMPLEQLVPVLAEVGERFPATHLRLTTEMMGGPIARLMEGRADIAVATLDGVSLNQVEAQQIANVVISPMATPALTEHLGTGVMSTQQMQTVPQIVVSGTGGPDNEQSRDLLPGGRKWTVSDFAAKKHVIQNGLGWGGLPDHLAAGELSDGSLVRLDVEGFPPRRSAIFALRRVDAAQGPVATAFWTRLSEMSDSPE